jgi:glycosyltransferase involved in cell wall biosynthesis
MYSEQEFVQYLTFGVTMKLVRIKKHSHFSGAVRNEGIAMAQGDIICYLDIDDIFMPGHLQAIWSGFLENSDAIGYRRWVYFNTYLADHDLNPVHCRDTHLRYGGIGTGAFAHEKSLGVRWSDGYGHDWLYVQRLMEACPHTKKIAGPRYLVCHLPGYNDF